MISPAVRLAPASRLIEKLVAFARKATEVYSSHELATKTPLSAWQARIFGVTNSFEMKAKSNQAFPGRVPVSGLKPPSATNTRQWALLFSLSFTHNNSPSE